ncbi:MAG: S-layer homology domain-containing protein [Clostridia bacterium]|nr:S-layer homology domain-containing protein [Clostridia bacterium]
MQLRKRMLSAILAASMLASTGVSVFAKEPLVSGNAEISFSAAKYNVVENEGEYKVKVVRKGGNDRSVAVVFKTADFMAVYGEDYVVLDEYGDELPLQDGISPDASDFSEVSGDTADVLTSGNDDGETAKSIINDDGDVDAQLSAIDYTETDNDVADYTNSDRTSTGSPLLDARAEYLDLPDTEKQEKESVETALTKSNEYFQSARGALGVVVFEEGDTEKEITIKLIDNDKPEADKIVLLSLMGINGDEETTLSANPTAYLNILDDEAYEKPVIEAETTAVTLTESESTYSLRLIRTAGVDYYTSVKVSTVKETAAEDIDYKKIEDASVSFAPGETEKTVKLSALNFDSDKSYGLRIKSDGTCDVVNDYITVQIDAAAAELSSDSAENSSDSAELMGYTLGSAQTSVNLNKYEWTGINDGGSDHWRDKQENDWGFDLRAKENDKGNGIGWRTSGKKNFYGIDSVDFHITVGGKGSKGFNSYFELHSNENFHGGDGASCHISGKSDWTWRNVSVSKPGEYYVKVKTIAKTAGKHNPMVQLGNPLKYNWKKYKFETGHNEQYFHRFLYNYDTKTGERTKIAFTDGSDDYDYQPTGVIMVDGSGREVTDFYCSANQTVKPFDTNAAKNSGYGLELEGVYLYVKQDREVYSKEINAPFKEHWYTDKTIWVPMSGVTINQSFAKTLYDTFGSNSTIKVMPKYKQADVTLNIHNIDSAKTYIANMTSNNTKNASFRDWGSNGYYNQYTFPKYSKIKVRAIAAPKKTLTGFYIDHWSLNPENDPIYSDSDAPSKMTYTLTENMSFYPRTEDQGMNIEYMPTADKTGSLEGRVYRQPSLVEESTDIETSDADGKINIETVYPGMRWVMRATAPEGYYVKWTNGTGDIKNVNGRIDVSTDSNINEETANTKRGNYNPVYGDIMSGTINQDNTKYYYEFVKANGNTTGTVYGKVMRENGTFADIVSNKRLENVPVASTQVSVAGTAGFTDSNGDFAIELQNVPTSGLVSVIVDNEGTQYPTVALANYMAVRLPAYECFKPKSLSVKYKDTANKINDNVANIKSDTLTVRAEVESNGSIQPVAANFYIHKANGAVISCNSDTRFKVNCVNNVGILEFNPDSVMDMGDKIYVSFTDQNGKEYKSMDIGYTFIVPLNIRTFMMPLIGSTLVDDTLGGAVELIGDPLGNLFPGTLKFDDPYTDTVVPDGFKKDKEASSEDEKDIPTYARSTYKFGDFSKAIKKFGDKYSPKKSESTASPDPSATPAADDEPEPTPDAKKLGEAAKEAVSEGNGGEETTGGGYKTNKSFSWSVAPRVAFALQITTREVKGADGKIVGKYFFEELDFLIGLNVTATGNITITLPIGMNVIIKGDLLCDVAGIYQLKTDYTMDSTWEKNKVEYSPESFGLFEEIDNVDRTVYLMLNPKITLGLEIEYAIVDVGGTASFNFDMDFKFGLNKGELTQHMYGDMTINFDYFVKVMTLKVYSGKTNGKTIPLFSKNADGHIEPDVMAGLLGADDATIESVPVSREYLNNASEWNAFMNNAELFDIDAANGTKETVLKSGVYPSSKFKLTNIGDGRMLMLFISDIPERNAVNRTALCYSIYDGTAWSAPLVVDDDGTADDYPEAIDLGDRVLVAWSSADRALEDSITTQDALTALDIKVSFFDKQTNSFSAAEQITHTTNEDYTADTEPKAAYDSETDRIILYYTKTEYKDVDKLTDLLNAPSVIAYRFYENGKWNDETSYTDDELGGITDKETYKTEWYGQRFLDTRINKTSGNMHRIVDADVCYYNGLALYAWTVDYDKDMNTVDDRDILMQIYNFAENSFTHIIKMTTNTGAYSTPHFGRYNDKTYLFFAAAGDLDGGDEETSGIAYVNVTEPIKNSQYKLVENGNTQYYVLQYNDTIAETETSEGVTIPEHEVTINIQPEYAVTMDGYVNNYSVDVDENERMYLTWTDSVNGDTTQRQVFTAIYDVVADEDETSETGWSEPFMLTSVPSTAYSSIDTAVVGGELYVAADKTPYIEDGELVSLDEDNTSMVILKHTPYSKPVTAEENALAIDTNYVYPNTPFTLTSTVKNEGVKFIHEPVKFRFTMTSNGKVTELGEQTLDYHWGAGKTMSASVNVTPISEISDDLTFNAEITVGETVINQTFKAVKEYDVISDGEATIEEKTTGHELSLPLRNDGNIPTGAVTVKLYTVKDGEKSEEPIAELSVDSIAENSTEIIGGAISIPDSAYQIDGGNGTANIIAVVEADGDEVISIETNAYKLFDADAIETMSKITDVSLKDEKTISAKYLDDISIDTVITGEASDKVKVVWESDNSNVVYVREDGTLCAVGNGKATLTGYVVPDVQSIVFAYDGSSTVDNMLSEIPSYLHKTVSATVNVSAGSSSSSGSSGGGSTSYTVTFDGGEGVSVDSIKLNKNGTVSELPVPTREGYTFEGWYTDEALTKPFATDTKITSNIKLYAKWTENKQVPQNTENPTKTDSDVYVNPFKDVSENDWFANSVRYVHENNLFSGVSENEFAPYDPMTRAMLVTVLYRTEGEPEITAENGFDDVISGSYYESAVAWAKENGIVKGYSDTEFAPDDNITREQIAAIMFRFAQFKKTAPEGAWAIRLDYADLGDICDWAVEAVMFCKLKGIMHGNENNEFKPDDNATRAESAAIVERFIESSK